MAENLKRATSNEEVDTSITSFTSLVENVAKPFFKKIQKKIIMYKMLNQILFIMKNVYIKRMYFWI